MSKRLGGIIGCNDKTSSWHLNGSPDGRNIGSTVSSVMSGSKPTVILFFFFFFFSFISLIADGPHHYHPACGHKGSSHLSPVHALQFFYRDASSALLQLVNQWLNFTGGEMSKRLGGIIGCNDKTSSWHLNGSPDGRNIGSTVSSVMSGSKPTVILFFFFFFFLSSHL